MHIMNPAVLPLSIHPSQILRPLGSLEQFFWLADHNRALHFALAAEVSGESTIEGWRSALDTVQRRHPLLSVCIEENAPSAPVFLRVLEARIPLRVVSGTEIDPAWEREVEREMAQPFDPARAPLARAALLHGAHRSVIILTMYHAVADGVAATYVLRDILRALAGERLDALPVPPPHEEALGLSESAGAPATSDPAKPASYRSDEGPPPRIKTHHLSAKATGELHAHARREGTSVHGALAAALSIATRQISSALDHGPVRIFSPIDTRKTLGLTDECIPAIGNALLSLDPSTGGRFWDLARQATDALAPARTRESLQGGRARMRQALAGSVDVRNVTNAFAYEILLTNLGSLPFETRFGDFTLERLLGPSLLGSFEGAQTIGVTTVHGAMSLLQTSNTIMEPLLSTTAAILAEACAG